MATCLKTAVLKAGTNIVKDSTTLQTAYVFVPDADTPIDNCALVVLEGAEFLNFSASPFALSPQDGAEVGGAVLLLWAVAWIFRQIGKMISIYSSSEETQ